MNWKDRAREMALGLLVAILAASPARAGQVVGGTLVDGPALAQLEGWLGEGELTLTNIFTKTAGDEKDDSSFHAAVDGRT
jgi:hypothetical protein